MALEGVMKSHGWYRPVRRLGGDGYSSYYDGWTIIHPDEGGWGHPLGRDVDHRDLEAVERLCRRLNRRLWWKRLWARITCGIVYYPIGGTRHGEPCLKWRPAREYEERYRARL